MITNLKDVVANIKDLLEIKKEKLRELWENEEILKSEIVELENALSRLDVGSIVLSNSDKTNTTILAIDLVKFIKASGPVSLVEIKKHFNCQSKDAGALSYLVRSRQIVRAGINEEGYTLYNVTN